MYINQIVFAVGKFYEMCAMHPEICPHNYLWTGSIENKETCEIENTYKCSLCGDRIKKIVGGIHK